MLVYASHVEQLKANLNYDGAGSGVYQAFG